MPNIVVNPTRECDYCGRVETTESGVFHQHSGEDTNLWYCCYFHSCLYRNENDDKTLLNRIPRDICERERQYLHAKKQRKLKQQLVDVDGE